MFEKSDKKLVVLVAPVALAVAMAVGTAQAGSHGGKQGTWTTSGSGGSVMNSAGKCWNTAGGKNEFAECGDMMPKAMKVKDSDGDGVPDDKDACPNTAKGVAVTEYGCPRDSDGDGVPDYKDSCPGTPAGVKVNAVGCEIAGDVTINVTADHFDFDSAELKPAMESALTDVANQVLNSPGNEQVEVIGHTDSTGPEAYNQMLSERRAQAAVDFLGTKGVYNTTAKGMGESAPIADNGTSAGRAMNRRVEIRTK